MRQSKSYQLSIKRNKCDLNMNTSNDVEQCVLLKYGIKKISLHILKEFIISRNQMKNVEYNLRDTFRYLIMPFYNAI